MKFLSLMNVVSFRTSYVYYSILFLFGFAGIAQEVVELQKLNAPVMRTQQQIGTFVGVSGDHIILGARGEEFDVNDENEISAAGAVYFYKRNGDIWEFHQKLVQDTEDRAIGNELGVGVAIEGEYAIAGAWKHSIDGSQTFLGSAVIYKKDENDIWQQYQKIDAGDQSVTGERFGFPVKIKNGTILVGALEYGAFVNGDYQADIGAVYVFEKDETTQQWNKTQKLVPNDSNGYDGFGKMMDIENGTIIVGANLHEPNEGDDWVGAAYVYNKNNEGVWVNTQKLDGSNRANKAQFGESLSMTGDYVIIGCPGQILEGSNNEKGAVYVFKKDETGQWNETQYVTLDELGFFDDYFGQSISTHGNKVVVTANDQVLTDLTQGSGYMYIYELNTQTNQIELLERVRPENGYSPKRFGLHVSTDGETIVVGDRDDNGADQGLDLYRTGAAHVFAFSDALSTPDWDTTTTAIQLYPNPVENNLYIQSKAIGATAQITITDVLGRTVYQASEVVLQPEHRITTNFAKGTYVLKLTVAGKTEVAKFVKS